MFGFDDIIAEIDAIMVDNDRDPIPGPLEKVQSNDFKEHLAKCVATLQHKERLVLNLYYQEELNLKEIGEVLNVSESRISQIHSQAMIKLQAKINR